MRKTKIVCTLGPASSEDDIMRQMLLAGLDVARVNFSHGDHESHGEMIDRFRRVRDDLGKAAAVMLDTKGPEIRTGNFKEGKVMLEAGQTFTLTTREADGDSSGCSITYKMLPAELKQGDTVLIDDGKIRLTVKETTVEDIVCTVENSGPVSNHKGINVPKVRLSMEYLSPTDQSDLLFGIEKDVDYVAASFVRKADDVRDLRRFLDQNGGQRIKIISKIENLEGIENFEEILSLSDGIMVARGDMGVEVEFERLPGIQKRFIKRCQQSGKIVITATQMLESMIGSPVPTRAEITDVANAVFDGTSAVMLSGESAMGKYPVEAVKAMARIARQAEHDDPRNLQGTSTIRHEMDADDTTNAVGHAACTLAQDIRAAAILAITKTGYTASRMSKFRPSTRVIAVTPHEKTFHQLAMIWGVQPVIVENLQNVDVLIYRCLEESRKQGFLRKGDKVVISAGVPLDVPGNTNMIRVERV
ncbi:MAG: pyruvate kinase [Anaerovoracaceae bacterium]|nr:pyruvate kinase [Anaerovoracaceae bacterium]